MSGVTSIESSFVVYAHAQLAAAQLHHRQDTASTPDDLRGFRYPATTKFEKLEYEDEKKTVM